MLLIDRATEQLKPIAKYWSTSYSIKSGNDPDALAYIDFENIYLNEEYNYLTDIELQALLLHEYGHRFIAPGKISLQKKQEIIDKSFQHCGVALNDTLPLFNGKHQVIYLLINIAYDLIVDRFYINNNEWQDIYTQGFVKINYDLFINYLDNQHESLTEQYSLLQSILTGITYFNIISKQQTAKEHLSYRKQCKPFLRIIHNKKNDLPERVSQFVGSLFSLFNENNEIKHLEAILIKLLKTIYRLNDRQINDYNSSHSGFSSQLSTITDPPLTDNSILFNAHLVNEIRGYLLKTYQSSRQLYNTWSFSDPFNKLNLKRSYRKSDTLMPGLTTKKEDYSENTQSVIKHQELNLCVMVDDSASMSGTPALFSRSITQAINEFVSVTDKPLGLISFGSDTNICMPPGFRYREITEAIVGLNGELGGTNLEAPLILLTQWLQNYETINHLLLITDAEMSDWKHLNTIIGTLLERIKITILLINSEIPEELNLLDNKKLSLFKINPEAEFNHAILEEIIP